MPHAHRRPHSTFAQGNPRLVPDLVVAMRPTEVIGFTERLLDLISLVLIGQNYKQSAGPFAPAADPVPINRDWAPTQVRELAV